MKWKKKSKWIWNNFMLMSITTINIQYIKMIISWDNYNNAHAVTLYTHKENYRNFLEVYFTMFVYKLTLIINEKPVILVFSL
jgi:hypothetical protein